MAIEFLYDLYNKDLLLVYKPHKAISRVIARIKQEKFDAKSKSLQEFIESSYSGKYFKPRYIKITEFYIPKSELGYSFDNLLYIVTPYFGRFSESFKKDLLQKIWRFPNTEDFQIID